MTNKLISRKKLFVDRIGMRPTLSEPRHDDTKHEHYSAMICILLVQMAEKMYPIESRLISL